MNPTDRETTPTPEPESDDDVVTIFTMRMENLGILRTTLCDLENAASLYRIMHAAPPELRPTSERARVTHHHALKLEEHFARFRALAPGSDILDEELDRLLPRLHALRDELRDMVG